MQYHRRLLLSALSASLPLAAHAAGAEPTRLVMTPGALYGGFYRALTEALLAPLEGRAVVADCPLARCLLMLESGQADLMFGLRRSPERERYLHFLAAPYLPPVDIAIYVRRGEAARVRRYDDLLGLQIAVQRGAQLFAPLDQDTRVRRQVTGSHNASMRMLAAGRVDAVPLALSQGEILRERLGLTDQVEPAQWRARNPETWHAAIARSSALMARVAELEASMQALATNGRCQALYMKHVVVATAASSASQALGPAQPELAPQ